MKTSSRFLAAVAVSAGFLASCADIEEINNRLDEFDGRITALETVTTTLNKNVEALQTLYGGATINSATEKDGIWALVLSNGETLTLTQGSIGVGNAPVMSVDKDGYWMVNYGSGAEYILKDGNKVSAIGTDGKTPVFGVDADGYWTVKYDADATAEQILGADGKPVKALPEGDIQDPYFSDVKMENGQFMVTLHSGEQLVIPVVSDFFCSIEAEGEQMFDAGETKPYNVSIKGVKSTMITAPAGWNATLSEPADEKAVLTVTAPVATKAVIADSKSDICILAFSSQGLATIAKMSVSCSDTPVMANPVASVTAGEATETTLAYSIAVSDVTSWKYIHLKESEAAPDAAKILSEGTEGSQSSLTFEGLDSETSYVLYVLPINGDIQGTVASGKNTTLEQLIESYYSLYNDGQTITINGEQFSKEIYGDATLMETDGNITTNGVYFLKEGVTATFAGTGAINKLAVIGDKDGTRSTFKLSGDAFLKLRNNVENAYLIFDNIVFDHTASTKYAMTVNANDEAFPSITFSNCEIKQNTTTDIIYISNATRSVKSLTFANCDCKISSTRALLGNSSVASAHGTFTITNCVFYGDGTITFNMHTGAAATYENVIFTNNTLVNILANSAWFNCGAITNTTVTGNIFHMNSAIALSNNQCLLKSANATITNGTVNNNIGYTGQEKIFQAIYGGAQNWPESGVEEITNLDTDPFTGGTFDLTNGKFTPTADYSSYGAQR